MIRHTDADFADRLAAAGAASSLFDAGIEARTRAIVEDVRARGDAALLELTARFDGAELTAEQLPVSAAELLAASLKADPALRLRFTSADLAGKGKAGLDMASLPLPDAADVGAPLNPGIEWYVPASKLCSLIETVKDLDVFSINPGVASRADWTQIAFKGGSEAGVASLTTALTNTAGEHFCVSVIWNDSQALDEERFTSLYGSLIGKLAGK